MSPAEFADAMRAIIAATAGDPEIQHSDCDDLMQLMLIELGYGEGVRLTDELGWWYA